MTWKLHNAMWPGLVGKDEDSDQPPISLEKMIDLTVASNAGGRKYDGIDLFLFFPHLDIDATDDDIRKFADDVAAKDLKIGSVVAPIWQETGGGSAMGDQAAREEILRGLQEIVKQEDF